MGARQEVLEAMLHSNNRRHSRRGKTPSDQPKAASSYTIFKSATLAGSYTSTATGVTGTSWTSGTLSNGNVYFKVEAFVGTLWVSAQSVATGESTISNSGCVQP